MPPNKTRIIFSCIAVVLTGLNMVSYSQEMTFSLLKPKNRDTYVIAHRGVHDVFSENTLAAYQKAIEIGCDFIEIDLRKTKDGEYVSIHNEDIDAYFEGETGKINSFKLSELKQMPLSKKGANNTNAYIPTLKEILTLCKGKIGIYLDLKEADIKGQVKIIKAFEMEKSIVWYIPASHTNEIKELQKYCRGCLVMPDHGAEVNLIKAFDSLQPTIIASDMGNLTSGFVSTTHSYGAKVFVDDDTATMEEWQKIISWGVDGIQTDQPEKLINFLRRGK